MIQVVTRGLQSQLPAFNTPPKVRNVHSQTDLAIVGQHLGNVETGSGDTEHGGQKTCESKVYVKRGFNALCIMLLGRTERNKSFPRNRHDSNPPPPCDDKVWLIIEIAQRSLHMTANLKIN
jgi:hypothetical protein